MKLLKFPQVGQTYEYDCGPKALQAVLIYYGIEVREELLFKYTKTSAKYGTTINGILRGLDKYKLKYDAKNMNIKDLKSYIRKKIPVFILLQAWGSVEQDYYDTHYDSGHWAVVIGYKRNKIYFEDPYAFTRSFLSNKELKNRWHGKEGKKKIINYGIAAYGPKPQYSSKKTIHMD